MTREKEKHQNNGLTITCTDIQKFVDCWNIYAGLYFETNGVSRRMEAIQKYAEMAMFLGAKSIELADGVRAEPDYFPVLGVNGEFDWIMGFSLTMFNKPMGRINSVAIHGGMIILTCENIVIGFKYKGEDFGKADKKARSHL